MGDSPLSFSDLAQQYRHRLTICRQLEVKKSFLHERLVQLRGTNDPQIRAVIPILSTQLRQLGERIWQDDKRMSEAAQAVNSEISRLGDNRLELILRCRYLELMTWDEISELTGLGLRWLHRLHKKGLNMLCAGNCRG